MHNRSLNEIENILEHRTTERPNAQPTRSFIPNETRQQLCMHAARAQLGNCTHSTVFSLHSIQPQSVRDSDVCQYGNKVLRILSYNQSLLRYEDELHI